MVINKRLGAIAAYLKQVAKNLARGDSTEHTHRPALQQLIQQLQNGIVCVNEPKSSSAAGHPDMKVLLGETPLGFIETKDVGLDLDETADTPQLKRYLEHIPNLILTAKASSQVSAKVPMEVSAKASSQVSAKVPSEVPSQVPAKVPITHRPPNRTTAAPLGLTPGWP